MNLQVLYKAWQSGSILARVVFLCGCAALLMVVASAGAKGWEHLRSAAFDLREAKREREVEQMSGQIEELKRRAEKAEAQAEVAEQRAAALDELSRQQDERVRTAAEKVDAAFVEYKSEAAETATDMTVEERRRRICEKRKELGYPCA
jgi:hypothetical protein